MWTRFMDMYSGGGPKESWEYIYIEAPENIARVVFYNRFDHSADRVTCTCCGPDYGVDDHQDLRVLTAYERNCGYDEESGEYVEVAKISKYTTYRLIPLDEYFNDPKVKVIYAKDITHEETLGSIPEQGYVWK